MGAHRALRNTLSRLRRYRPIIAHTKKTGEERVSESSVVYRSVNFILNVSSNRSHHQRWSVIRRQVYLFSCLGRNHVEGIALLRHNSSLQSAILLERIKLFF
jgi:hypothetical protein